MKKNIILSFFILFTIVSILVFLFFMYDSKEQNLINNKQSETQDMSNLEKKEEQDSLDEEYPSSVDNNTTIKERLGFNPLKETVIEKSQKTDITTTEKEVLRVAIFYALYLQNRDIEKFKELLDSTSTGYNDSLESKMSLLEKHYISYQLNDVDIVEFSDKEVKAKLKIYVFSTERNNFKDVELTEMITFKKIKEEWKMTNIFMENKVEIDNIENYLSKKN